MSSVKRCQREEKLMFACGSRRQRRKRRKEDVYRGRSNRIYWFLVCEAMCRSKVIYVETRVIVWCEIMMEKLVSDVAFTRKGRSVEAEARTKLQKCERESSQRKEKASTR